MTLTHHNDPGHGWVEVPVALLHELGIADQVTPFSYQRGDTAYLEEDVDAGTLCRALAERGITVTWRDSYTQTCFVRSLPTYRG